MAPNKIPLGFLSCSNNIRKKKIKNLADDDELPLEIWGEILLRFPAESLFQFRAVCKRWRRVIDDPNFAWAHNNKLQLSSSSHTLVFKSTFSPSESLYTFDLDALLVNSDDKVQSISGYSLDLTNESWWPLNLPNLPVSTCSGLMLVVTTDKTTTTTPIFEIWNLSTNERLQLPRLEDFRSDRATFIGLGYEHAAQDFKAVVIQGQRTHVYSLRSDTWMKINGPGVYGVYCSPQRNDGVYMCGALHWLPLFDNKILALDLGTEKHRLIQLPPNIQKIVEYKNVDVLGGCLVLSALLDSVPQFDVWVMKDYGSGYESWIKLFSIKRDDLPYCFIRPVAYIKDKNQVLLKVDGPGFILFDVESNSMKSVRIHGIPADHLGAQIIPQSMFRLRDHCGGGGSRTSRIKRIFYRTTKMEEEVCTTINT